MPYSSSTIILTNPFEVTWNLLLDALIHPSYYMATVESYEIKDRTEDEFIRHLKTKQLSTIEKVKINFRTKEVLLTLMDHPRYRGTVVFRVLEQKNKNAESEVALTMTLDWKDLKNLETPLDNKFSTKVEATLENFKSALIDNNPRKK